MSFDPRNTMDIGSQRAGKNFDPLQTGFGQFGDGHLFYGVQPWGMMDGSTIMQGSWGPYGLRASNFVVTANGGAGTTPVIGDAFPPILSFVTRATADGDGYNLQWSGDGGTTVHEAFKPTADTVIVGYIRFKADNAADDAHTKSRWYFGIGDADTNIHSTTGNFFGLYKASGAATIAGITDATARDSHGTVASMANDTRIQLGFRIEGVSSFSFWSGSGRHAASMVKAYTASDVSDLMATEGALTFQGLTSEAAAITYTIEHAMVIQAVA